MKLEDMRYAVCIDWRSAVKLKIPISVLLRSLKFAWSATAYSSINKHHTLELAGVRAVVPVLL